MDVFDKILKEHSWRFPKGYPDMNNPKDKEFLFSIVENYLKEVEVDSVEDIEDDVVLDPKQDSDEIEDTKDELQDLLKNVKNSSQKKKVINYLKNLEYIDKVNHYLDKKNFEDIEEILVKTFIDRNNQYKIFYEYLPKMIKYNQLPPQGNLVDIFEKYNFSTKFLLELLKRDYQAGGKGVGPGELFLVTLLKDTYKGGVGDVQVKAEDPTGVIVASGKEIEIKATGAQLSPFSRSDKFQNNFYKWLPKNYPDYVEIYNEGKRRVPYRIQNLINSLDNTKAKEFIKDFVPYFTKLYSERADIKPALNKAISGTKFDGSKFENEMAKILAKEYIERENIEGFLFLDKKSGNFDTFTSKEVVDNIGDGKLEVSAFSDMSPRLRLKK